ncbi:large conductance mechanosensitive channel protein MscL [Sphingosinicella microcystinivorans]|uniref:Large-conductance mechanosensitive channel n=1 Tax=Sphingosinicella microcystinivorans TaxID=335406 RepID=A0AAD1G048_SPHMI|nr:large conductance mechanosensitive channel protein MscL [Sphingosinicella microcystinivorans]RKS85563.1 large conductance mechanosensitive channel [Sphingosinicella microcystinivorans]BBE33146.1 large-conductance mechanosensitive channel [Sphingosinicella microcystinivorans]
MLNEFKAFIAKGNVLDLAVAVIIGGAFGTIVTSLTQDVIMPVVGAIFGGLDFSSLFIRLGAVPEGYAGSMTDYAALKEAGVPMLGYGAFITAAINFLILAFIIFLLVRMANRLIPKKEEAPAAGPSEEVLLLREIRDSLKK